MIKVRPTQVVETLDLSTIQDILKKELVTTLHAHRFHRITGVSMDSRDLYPQELFLALDGDHFHGVNFIESAFDQGSRVFVLDQKYHTEALPKLLGTQVFEQSCFLIVQNPVDTYGCLAHYYLHQMGGVRIAITGSAGKTSLKEILKKTFEAAWESCRVFTSTKNENNRIGIPKNVFHLHRLLMGWQPKHDNQKQNTHPIQPPPVFDVLIFELGMSFPNELNKIAKVIKPHIAIITNVLYAHIGNFSCREDLVQAKGEIIPHIIGYREENHLAISNHQPWMNGLLVLPHDIFGKDILLSLLPKGASALEVNDTVSANYHWTHDNIKKSQIGLPSTNSRGFHSIWTDTLTNTQIQSQGLKIFTDKSLSLILAFIQYLGGDRETVFRKLGHQNTLSHIVKQRLEMIDIPHHPLIIDDSYNANPDSMIQTVTTLLECLPNILPYNLVLILGDMLELGKFSKTLHRELAQAINHSIEQLDLPSPQKIGIEKFSRKKSLSFFFIGLEMKICYDNVHFDNKYYFLNQTGVVQELWKQCDEHSLVFLKASRAMKFNTLVSALLR